MTVGDPDFEDSVSADSSDFDGEPSTGVEEGDPERSTGPGTSLFGT